MSVYGGGGLSGGDLWDPLETGARPVQIFCCRAGVRLGAGEASIWRNKEKRKGLWSAYLLPSSFISSISNLSLL